MVELVTEIEPKLLDRLVLLEKEAFGNGGMNEWHLVPVIRHGRVFVIKENDVVVGEVQYMLDWDKPGLAYLIGVAIAGEVRGKGIGTELLTKSIKSLFDDKVTTIELTVEADNLAAIRVYKEKLGFEVTDFRENEYGPGQDRLVMALTSDKFAGIM